MTKKRSLVALGECMRQRRARAITFIDDLIDHGLDDKEDDPFEPDEEDEDGSSDEEDEPSAKCAKTEAQ